MSLSLLTATPFPHNPHISYNGHTMTLTCTSLRHYVSWIHEKCDTTDKFPLEWNIREIYLPWNLILVVQDSNKEEQCTITLVLPTGSFILSVTGGPCRSSALVAGLVSPKLFSSKLVERRTLISWPLERVPQWRYCRYFSIRYTAVRQSQEDSLEQGLQIQNHMGVAMAYTGVKSEVLTAAVMNVATVPSCLCMNWRFGGMYHLYLQGRNQPSKKPEWSRWKVLYAGQFLRKVDSNTSHMTQYPSRWLHSSTRWSQYKEWRYFAI
jgi:hypothetical protein